MGHGVEESEGVYFVAKELDADGKVETDGEDIKNSAAAGELSGDADWIGGFVAEGDEAGGGIFRIDFGVGGKFEGVFGEIEGVEGALEGSLGDCDDDSGFFAGEESERAEPVGEGNAFGGGIFEKGAESAGEEADAVLGDSIEDEFGLPGDGGIVAADDKEDLSGGLVIESGDEARSGARGEACPGGGSGGELGCLG